MHRHAPHVHELFAIRPLFVDTRFRGHPCVDPRSPHRQRSALRAALSVEMEAPFSSSATVIEVADHGPISVVRIEAAGLIGRRLLLPNRLWDGCEEDEGRSRCEIVAYTDCLEGKAAYIVRAIAEKCNYAFEPLELLEYLPKDLARNVRAGLMEANLLAQLEGGFAVAEPDAEPPDFGAEDLNIRSGAVFARARNLHKALWLDKGTHGTCPVSFRPLSFHGNSMPGVSPGMKSTVGCRMWINCCHALAYLMDYVPRGCAKMMKRVQFMSCTCSQSPQICPQLHRRSCRHLARCTDST